MQTQGENSAGIIRSQPVTHKQAVERLTAFLQQEQGKRESLDSVVYIKEHLIEQLTRIRSSLAEHK